MERKEIIEILKNFNLTRYEAYAYTALLTLGPSKASDISKEAEVPQSKIYSVLEKLTDKHLVEFAGGTPKRFRAVSPNIGLRTLLEERELALKELKSKINFLAKSLKSLKREVIEGVWTTKGKGLTDFVNRLSDMYDRGKKYAYVVTRDFTWSPRVAKSVKAAIKRGVKIGGISIKGIDKTNYHRAKWFNDRGVTIKVFKTDVHPRIIDVDGREVLIRLDYNPTATRNFKFTSLYSADPSLVKVFDVYMKNLWKIAKPVDFDKLARKLRLK